MPVPSFQNPSKTSLLIINNDAGLVDVSLWVKINPLANVHLRVYKTLFFGANSCICGVHPGTATGTQDAH